MALSDQLAGQLATAYASGDIDALNRLLQENQVTEQTAQNYWGFTPEQTSGLGFNFYSAPPASTSQPFAPMSAPMGDGAASANMAPGGGFVTDVSGRQYDPSVLLNLIRQIEPLIDKSSLSGGAFGTSGATIGFNYDDATRILGRAPSAYEQVLLDMARELNRQGVTDVSQINPYRFETPGIDLIRRKLPGEYEDLVNYDNSFYKGPGTYLRAAYNNVPLAAEDDSGGFGVTYTGGGGTMYRIGYDAQGNMRFYTEPIDTSEPWIEPVLAFAAVVLGAPYVAELLASGASATEIAALADIGAGATAGAGTAVTGLTGIDALIAAGEGLVPITAGEVATAGLTASELASVGAGLDLAGVGAAGATGTGIESVLPDTAAGAGSDVTMTAGDIAGGGGGTTPGTTTGAATSTSGGGITNWLSTQLSNTGIPGLSKGSILNNAVTNGLINGTMSVASGKDFESGFISGLISGGVSGGIRAVLPTEFMNSSPNIAAAVSRAGGAAVAAAAGGRDILSAIENSLLGSAVGYATSEGIDRTGLFTQEQARIAAQVMAPIVAGLIKNGNVTPETINSALLSAVGTIIFNGGAGTPSRSTSGGSTTTGGTTDTTDTIANLENAGLTEDQTIDLLQDIPRISYVNAEDLSAEQSVGAATIVDNLSPIMSFTPETRDAWQNWANQYMLDGGNPSDLNAFMNYVYQGRPPIEVTDALSRIEVTGSREPTGSVIDELLPVDVTGTRVTPTPTRTPTPTATLSPVDVTEPRITPTPTVTLEPVDVTEPRITPTPTATLEPVDVTEPRITPTPTASLAPVTVTEPRITPTPTATPQITLSPVTVTPSPVITLPPVVVTASPVVTLPPVVVTPAPTVSPAPSPTVTPTPTATPVRTAAPVPVTPTPTPSVGPTNTAQLQALLAQIDPWYANIDIADLDQMFSGQTPIARPRNKKGT